MAVPAHRETALFKRILQELLSHKVLQRSQSKIPNGADEGPATARALKHQQTTSLKPLYLIFDFNVRHASRAATSQWIAWTSHKFETP